jgi:hypothetical protein
MKNARNLLHDLGHGLPAILGEMLVGIGVGIVAVVLFKIIKPLIKRNYS